MYHPTESLLALPDLVALLGEQQKTGVVSTTLTALPLANKRLTGSYLAQVVVEPGHVRTCSITERETGINILEGQVAFAALCTLEGVCWQVRLAGTLQGYPEHRPRALQTDGRLPSQTDPLVFVVGSIPSRLRQPEREEERTLSRHHRNVLRLIDGRHTTQQIAHLLALTPEQLGTILRDLLDATLIAFYER
jgi:hypothetical protein